MQIYNTGTIKCQGNVLSLISDKFTPSDKNRRMKYMMSAKELARLTVIKGAIDGAYTVKQAAKKTEHEHPMGKTLKESGTGTRQSFTETPGDIRQTLRTKRYGKK
jgi:hypothetical protein